MSITTPTFEIRNDKTGEKTGIFTEANVAMAKELFIKQINGGSIEMTENRSHLHLIEMGTWNYKNSYVFNKIHKLVCSGKNTPIR